MALNWGVKYPSQTGAPDADYPYGPAQNVTLPGDGTGFPWEADVINDWGGFFQALLGAAGITPSGDVDTFLASDYMDSLNVLLSAIDDKYLPNNVEKLLLNDASAAPGDANIGNGYQGAQHYGRGALSPQFYGRAALSSQDYGFDTIFDQNYGRSASGNQYYGESATGAIEIGSTTGSHATKKLISGAKEATFEEIIDVATEGWSAWTAVTYEANWAAAGGTGNVPLQYRKSLDGKNLQLRGSAESSTGAGFIIAILPAGYRPIQASPLPLGGLPDSTIQATVEISGWVGIFPPDHGAAHTFNSVIALD